MRAGSSSTDRFRRTGIPRRYEAAETSLSMPADASRGLYLWGAPGTGKTHAACALAMRAFAAGRLVRFCSMVELEAEVKATYGTRASEDDVVGPRLWCKLLVLDDLGKERPTEWSQALLYRIVDHRYNECLPTIVTSNYGRPELAARLAVGTDDAMAESIVSRLCEMCEAVEMRGADRRVHG